MSSWKGKPAQNRTPLRRSIVSLVLYICIVCSESFSRTKCTTEWYIIHNYYRAFELQLFRIYHSIITRDVGNHLETFARIRKYSPRTHFWFFASSLFRKIRKVSFHAKSSTLDLYSIHHTERSCEKMSRGDATRTIVLKKFSDVSLQLLLLPIFILYYREIWQKEENNLGFKTRNNSFSGDFWKKTASPHAFVTNFRAGRADAVSNTLEYSDLIHCFQVGVDHTTSQSKTWMLSLWGHRQPIISEGSVTRGLKGRRHTHRMNKKWRIRADLICAPVDPFHIR